MVNDTLFGPKVIKSISFDEGEILNSIQDLYCNHFELDPCYSIGNIYKRFGIKEPKYKFDIEPKSSKVLRSSAESLPFENSSIKSILFDPPFLASSGEALNSVDDNVNIITKRFSSFKNMEELWKWYSLCLVEFNRIMETNGILVFKNQDTVSCSKQYFSHVFIMNEAIKAGFYPKDLFILMAKNRIIGGNHAIQQHARKFHCYYWVFIKTTSKVKY